jgi:hypothetical protein
MPFYQYADDLEVLLMATDDKAHVLAAVALLSYG